MMRTKAFAKLNLFLEVRGKRADGYHELVSFMQTIDLCDELWIEPADRLSFQCSDPSIPVQGNLVVRAFEALQRRVSIKGAFLRLKKNIPHGAGLGGGSSDAAQTLKGLNEVYRLGFSKEELQEIGSELGSDVPFFLEEEAAIARGRGTLLQGEPSCPWPHLLLARPRGSIATAEVYASLKESDWHQRGNLEAFLEAYRRGDLLRAMDFRLNHLEKAAMRRDPLIGSLKAQMMEMGAFASMMSGSGNVVFGLFGDKIDLIKAGKQLEGEYPWVCATALR